jgi:hypothetical protein
MGSMACFALRACSRITSTHFGELQLIHGDKLWLTWVEEVMEGDNYFF